MKVAIVIPTRGDRPDLTGNLLTLIDGQTRKPDHVILVDYPAIDKTPDLVPRYKEGFKEAFSTFGCDLAICTEDDDWYAPTYVETIVAAFEKANRPDVLGIDRTLYYNIITNKYVMLNHPGRASMMSMAFGPGVMNMEWCGDEYTYLDWHIWTKDKKLRKVSVHLPMIAVGIKHGIGLCGGGGHVADWGHYKQVDADWSYLSTIITDEKQIEFYKQIQADATKSV